MSLAHFEELRVLVNHQSCDVDKLSPDMRFADFVTAGWLDQPGAGCLVIEQQNTERSIRT